MADKDDKSDKGWPDDGRDWHEFTDADYAEGERVARELEEKWRERDEHYTHAHSRDPIDGILNRIFGTSEECADPDCRRIEERCAEREAEEQARRESESWWETWSRHREEKREKQRVLGEILGEEESESWWQRWFGGSNTGGNGEGGSD